MGGWKFEMKQKFFTFLLAASLMIFYIHFTARYMQYFDIGLNNATRFIDIYWIRVPVAIIAQVIAVYLGNKFAKNIQSHVVYNLAIMVIVICFVFLGFALFDNGILREGGFLKFLGYYFFNLPPGQIPKGN